MTSYMCFAKTFKVNGQRDLRSGLVLGDIEAKYADKATGIAITKAWTTANHVNSKIELDNNLASEYKCYGSSRVILMASFRGLKSGVTDIIAAIHQGQSFQSQCNL